MPVSPVRPAVSIIVPTFNRRVSLERCLVSLLALDYHDFELVVVDDGSNDGTAEYLASLHDPRLRIVRHATNRGIAQARNSGLAAARHEFVACTDDDCTVTVPWLTELISGINDERLALVIGRTDYVGPGYRGRFPERVVTNQRGRWPGSGSILYRRSAVLASGGFDPAFEANHNEDTELAVRLVANGWRFVRRPSALVYHQHDVWTAGQLLRSAGNAAVWPRLKKRYPRHFRTFGGPVAFGCIVYPLDYLLLLFSPVVIPILLIRFIVNGQRSFGLFFTKWPLLLVWRRLRIYAAAINERVLML